MPVVVGADLVAVQPGGADLAHGGDDLGGGQEGDVRGAHRMPWRGVQHPVFVRQGVDAAEEEGHRRAVLGRQRAEPREQSGLQVGGSVPGEDDELRRRLSWLQPLGHWLVRLGTCVGGRPVADEPPGSVTALSSRVVPGQATTHPGPQQCYRPSSQEIPPRPAAHVAEPLPLGIVCGCRVRPGSNGIRRSAATATISAAGCSWTKRSRAHRPRAPRISRW